MSCRCVLFASTTSLYRFYKTQWKYRTHCRPKRHASTIVHALNRVQSTSVENWQFPLNYGKLHSANVFSSKFSAILTANDGQLMTACSRLVVTMALSLVSLGFLADCLHGLLPGPFFF